MKLLLETSTAYTGNNQVLPTKTFKNIMEAPLKILCIRQDNMIFHHFHSEPWNCFHDSLDGFGLVLFFFKWVSDMNPTFKELELNDTKYFTIIITVWPRLISRDFTSIGYPLLKLYCFICTVFLLWRPGGAGGHDTMKVKNFCTSTAYGC